MLKSNFTTEKGNMQYPVGKADSYFVRYVVCIRYAIGYRSVSLPGKKSLPLEGKVARRKP